MTKIKKKLIVSGRSSLTRARDVHVPQECRFPGELLRAEVAREEGACRIVDHLEMPLQTVANVESFVAEVTLVAAFRLIAAILIDEYLFAAGDVVGGGGGLGGGRGVENLIRIELLRTEVL